MINASIEMQGNDHTRQPRSQFTPDELARIIAFKQHKAEQRTKRFKASPLFKGLNLFNVFCFFIYWELLFCFIGPTFPVQVEIKHINFNFENPVEAPAKSLLTHVNVETTEGYVFHASINDSVLIGMKAPETIYLLKDFILQKPLKANFTVFEGEFFIKEANSVVFLSVFLVLINCIAFAFNLHEHPHSLTGISAVNAINFIVLFFI